MMSRSFAVAGALLAVVFAGCASDPVVKTENHADAVRAAWKFNSSAVTYSRTGHHMAACQNLKMAVSEMEAGKVSFAAINTDQKSMLSTNARSYCGLSSRIRKL